MSVPGALIFSFLFVVRVAQMTQTGAYLPDLLLAAQAGFAAFRMIFRKPALKESPWAVQVLAWISASIPFAMQTDRVSGWLSVPGLLLVLWAFWSLGDSFSIAPSARFLVMDGPYRLVRHPMYAGEILALFGLCLEFPSLWNWFVLLVFVLTIQVRIMHEEALLEHYPIYARVVKWRIFPGVW